MKLRLAAEDWLAWTCPEYYNDWESFAFSKERLGF
jgi:hypothetical protein